jgi:hypothetical protein
MSRERTILAAFKSSAEAQAAAATLHKLAFHEMIFISKPSRIKQQN